MPDPAAPAATRTVREGFAVLGHAIRQEPGSFVVAVAGAALYSIGLVGSGVVFGQVTDRVVLPAFEQGRVPAGALAAGGLVIVGVGVARGLGVLLRRTAAFRMQFRMQASTRRQVADRYLRLPLAWHRRHPTGRLLSTVNADVEAAFGAIAPLPFACGVLVHLVVAAGVIIATDPVLALIGALIAPLLALGNARYNRRVSGPAMRAQQLRGDVSAVAHESVDGALVVKTLGREDAEAERFRASSERLRDTLIEVGRIRAGYDPLLEALPNVMTLVVLLVGALRVGSGALTVGELVQVAYVFTLLALPVRMIGYLFAELPRSVVGWRRVAEVLAAEGATGYGSERLTATGPAHAALDDVTFRYASAPADVLAGVDLDLTPGRTVALVGPTGGGKSTIAALLLRLADPDAGAVTLDGADERTLAHGEVPGAAALVFQQAFLFDDTVRGNVTLGADVPDADVAAACLLAHADGFIRELPEGYETQIGERGATLSGGQRQRVALARALLRRPRLLVLDDATSSVDPSVEAAILADLAAADLPSTVVLVAYRRATIALADEVVFVADGRIVARGTHDELLATLPDYGALLAAQDGEPRPAHPVPA